MNMWDTIETAQVHRLEIVHIAKHTADPFVLEVVCMGYNPRALAYLLLHGGNPNGRDGMPLFRACQYDQPRMVELLLAAGAEMRNNYVMTPSCRRIFIANGKRGIGLPYFERAVLKCRRATSTMLRVKDCANLQRWDRFLLREVAVQVWATRYDDAWETKDEPLPCSIQ